MELPRDVELTLKCFRNLFNPELDPLDRLNLRDYFLYVTDHVSTKEMAERYSSMFANFSAKCVGMKFPDGWDGEKYSGFFLALSELLHVRFEISIVPEEKTTREDFAVSFSITLSKLR